MFTFLRGTSREGEVRPIASGARRRRDIMLPPFFFLFFLGGVERRTFFFLILSVLSVTAWRCPSRLVCARFFVLLLFFFSFRFPKKEPKEVTVASYWSLLLHISLRGFRKNLNYFILFFPALLFVLCFVCFFALRTVMIQLQWDDDEEVVV